MRSLLAIWRRIHAWPWWRRAPVKLLIFAGVLVLTLYPKVWLLPAEIARLRDVDSVIEPDHPGLAALADEVRHTATAAAAPDDEVPRAVERVVYRHIAYAFDWETWGVMDYLPSVGEVLERNQADCGGRAVVAASLLRRLGYEAHLVCDLKHIWVATATGEIMSPGVGEKSLVGGAAGTRVQATWDTLSNVGRGLSYGIAVFPLGREVIILVGLWAVTIQPRSARWRRIAGSLLLSGALLSLRWAGASAEQIAAQPLWVWVGCAGALVGWGLLVIRSRRQTATSA
jgi:hypothetical protein